MRSSRPLAAFLLVALICATPAHAQSCNDELLKSGLKFGDPGWDAAKAACVKRLDDEVLSGARGKDAQIGALCKRELVDRGMVPGVGAYQREMTACLARRNSEGEAGAVEFSAERPFGRGAVQDYLNALYNDDAAAMRSIDDRLASRMGTRLPVSLFNLIAQNYLSAYPSLYRACLEPDAPTITVGRVYDEVKRDGRGIEMGRRQVDERRQVRVNRRFMALAQGAGVATSGAGEDFVARLAGMELGEFAFSNVAAVVQRTMQRRPCDDPVTKRLEEKMVAFNPPRLLR